MRDEYDDEYVRKMQNLDFSCSMVLSMKKIFFGTGVNKYVEDGILRHLLTCESCRKAYRTYAQEVGFTKFNVIKYAIQFTTNNKDFKESKTLEYLSEIKANKPIIIFSRPWTRAANVFDIDKLMNMKAFRDLSMEYNSPTGLDYSDFMKYVILKIAKHIDHLEECLAKSKENNQ